MAFLSIVLFGFRFAECLRSYGVRSLRSLIPLLADSVQSRDSGLAGNARKRGRNVASPIIRTDKAQAPPNRNQRTSNTMKPNTKPETTEVQAAQAVETAAICSPCSLPCPKCGSTDIHRAYRKAGNSGDYNHDMLDRLDQSKPTHPIYPIKTEYILHICRCCSYRWGTDTLAANDKILPTCATGRSTEETKS